MKVQRSQTEQGFISRQEHSLHLNPRQELPGVRLFERLINTSPNSLLNSVCDHTNIFNCLFKRQFAKFCFCSGTTFHSHTRRCQVTAAINWKQMRTVRMQQPVDAGDARLSYCGHSGEGRPRTFSVNTHLDAILLTFLTIKDKRHKSRYI